MRDAKHGKQKAEVGRLYGVESDDVEVIDVVVVIVAAAVVVVESGGQGLSVQRQEQGR